MRLLSARLAARNSSATGLLRLLLVGSLVVPLLLFVALSFVDYQSALTNARHDLERTSEVAREHASRTFDGQSQVVERVNDLVQGMDEESVQSAEWRVHEGLIGIVGRLPQVKNVLILSKSGHPLASAGVYPVPRAVDLSDADYFRAMMNGYPGTYVSGVQLGKVVKGPFFGLAGRWRGASGTPNGVIDVAVLPSFFTDFYQAMIDDRGDSGAGKVLSLVRDDGQVLVRNPAFPSLPPKMTEPSPFFAAIKVSPYAGTYRNRSIIDPNSPARLYVYRKVEGYPLYVVAGRSWDAIVAEWYRTMAGYLLFGIPATMVLFAMTRTALVRTRREKEALNRANHEMERRRQAEDALLRAQRLDAVGQMTGGVAHDFNNLLTVILGNVEMIDKRADNPAIRRFAASIQLAARRGAEITQKLLAFSGRQMVKPEIVNLNRRLREFKPLLDRAASEAVEVDLDLDAGLHPVRLDPGQFEAAVLNLVGNARDAMKDGGRIVISTRNIRLGGGQAAELLPGAYVRVAVTDTGTGMDAATAARVFEPFFTTKDIGKGTGLGLSQVYGFARQARGDVRITSAPGMGTTVELLLPQSQEPAHAAGPASEQAAGIIRARPVAPGKIILVVEDEPVVLEMAVEILQGLGYVTLTAPNAPVALQRLRQDSPVDVLFSDIVMPGGMTGVQLASEAVRLRPNLKVLLTSGYTEAGMRRTLPNDILLLTKPYDSAQLARYIRATLDDEHSVPDIPHAVGVASA